MQIPSIRPAHEVDLAALYPIASESLILDSFSPALFREKLFKRPPAGEFEWNTWLAEVGGVPVGFMQSAVRSSAGKAWVGLFAVAPEWRRRGIATALFDHIRRRWPAGLETSEVLAIPGNYFTPGLDPRYTEALCFLERSGFERFRDCANLSTDLSRRFETAADESRLAGRAIEMRRANWDDMARLDQFFADHFGADWRYEAELAFENTPPSLHLALSGGAVIAFSAHSTQNQEWGFFGPMGTAPEARGTGIGRVLLWRCLNDLFDAGCRRALIPWVGPVSFYHRWAGSRVDRLFWRYRLEPGKPRGAH